MLSNSAITQSILVSARCNVIVRKMRKVIVNSAWYLRHYSQNLTTVLRRGSFCSQHQSPITKQKSRRKENYHKDSRGIHSIPRLKSKSSCNRMPDANHLPFRQVPAVKDAGFVGQISVSLLLTSSAILRHSVSMVPRTCRISCFPTLNILG